MLRGGSGDDTLAGGSGDDSLYGGSGDDTLSGGSGDDLLSGGSGDDSLDGGSGDDTLTGGSGSDVFRFGDEDIVTDFDTTDDLLNVSGQGVTAADFGERVSVTAAGSDTIVRIGEKSMWLTGVDSAEMSIDDFLLAGPLPAAASSADEDDLLLLPSMAQVTRFPVAEVMGSDAHGETVSVAEPANDLAWPADWQAQFSAEAAMQEQYAVGQYHTLLI